MKYGFIFWYDNIREISRRGEVVNEPEESESVYTRTDRLTT